MKEIGADIIIQRGDKLLLVQQRKAVAHGLWSYPGGHAESGETMEEALRREVKEELGTKLDQFQPLTITHIQTQSGHEIELHTYVGTIEGEITIPKHELMAYAWFMLSQLEGMKNQLRHPLVLELAYKSFQRGS